jgi:hypothetical protein
MQAPFDDSSILFEESIFPLSERGNNPDYTSIVIGPFPRPCVHGSYMHRAALFYTNIVIILYSLFVQKYYMVYPFYSEKDIVTGHNRKNKKK